MTKIEQAIAALERIARWHGEFPSVVGRDGKPSSYGVEYGSNGERDFMRQIALSALTALRSIPGPATEEEMQTALRGIYLYSWQPVSAEDGFRAAERRIFGEEK